MTHTIVLKAELHDRVAVRNYRRSNRWEEGAVEMIGVRWWLSPPPSIAYTVLIDRRSGLGNPIRLQVGGEAIRKLEAPQ